MIPLDAIDTESRAGTFALTTTLLKFYLDVLAERSEMLGGAIGLIFMEHLLRAKPGLKAASGYSPDSQWEKQARKTTAKNMVLCKLKQC